MLYDIKNMYVVNPAISKVRNMGWDATGNSFKDPNVLKAYGNVAEKHKKQLIDNAINFELEGNPMQHMEENDVIAAMYSDGKITYSQFVTSLFKYFKKKIIK